MNDPEKLAEYLERAAEAEREAKSAKDPLVAENWRRIAEDYRALAKAHELR